MWMGSGPGATIREFLRAASCTEHHNEVVDDAVLLWFVLRKVS